MRNITPGQGANFQPSFVADGSAELFVSERSGSPNVYRHVLASGAANAVTHTKESLYSPTVLPDGSGFVAVRVVTPDPYYGLEAQQPSLWRFGWDGKSVSPLVTTRRSAKRWVISAMSPGDAKPTVLVDTAVGMVGEAEAGRSQYFVGLPDGSLIMANGTRLLRWDGVKGSSFKHFAELGKLGGAIKNIAASGDGTHLALSVAMDQGAPAQ